MYRDVRNWGSQDIDFMSHCFLCKLLCITASDLRSTIVMPFRYIISVTNFQYLLLCYDMYICTSKSFYVYLMQKIQSFSCNFILIIINRYLNVVFFLFPQNILLLENIFLRQLELFGWVILLLLQNHIYIKLIRKIEKLFFFFGGVR